MAPDIQSATAPDDMMEVADGEITSVPNSAKSLLS